LATGSMRTSTEFCTSQTNAAKRRAQEAQPVPSQLPSNSQRILSFLHMAFITAIQCGARQFGRQRLGSSGHMVAQPAGGQLCHFLQRAGLFEQVSCSLDYLDPARRT
jgi:hypothetical protein